MSSDQFVSCEQWPLEWLQCWTETLLSCQIECVLSVE